MKIIHCGDIHLDSKIESNLTTAKSRERKKEIVTAFCRLVDYAEEQRITAVIIAGDLFDTDRMQPSTRDIVLGKIRNCKDTDFLCLFGNHDSGEILAECDPPENLKFFGTKWTKFTYGNVDITGAVLKADNCRSIYGSLTTDPDKFNIVTMHGELTTSAGECEIDRNELTDRGIDYLALGHYHSFSEGKLGKNGKWCYCGCLEGRGFDECGDKGFVLLDINGNSFSNTFVPFAKRKLYEISCDVTGLSDAGDMLSVIDSATADIDENSMVKVVLHGNIPADSRKETELFLKHLNEKFWFAKLYDETRIALNPEDYKNDISLKGEFIRLAMSSGLEGAELDRVIECGLRALSGEEVR